MPGRDDLVVERLELAHDAAMQHDGGAARRAGERQRATETAGRAGDQDRAPGEVDGGCRGGVGESHRKDKLSRDPAKARRAR